MTDSNHIVVFEHDIVKAGHKPGQITPEQFEALERFYGNGRPYYKLVHNGVQFSEYVGALQVGQTIITVLPKADKATTGEKKKWNTILIDMLRSVYGFDVHAPSSSELQMKNNTVLDLYFEMFIREVEYLLHSGLVKKYRKTEGNVLSFKGSIQFASHISKNLVHAERFYTRYTTYDTMHLLHCILFETIHVLKHISNNVNLKGRISALLLNFPEMPRMKITEHTFGKVVLNRKSYGYKTAIDIARLILFRYFPDLSRGRNDVLALMFDMNLLWEQFVLQSLKKLKGYKVHGQQSKYLWKPEGGRRRSIRPDITLTKGELNYVLDTKWKLINMKPSIEDIRQMYAYHHYFKARKVALLYPGDTKNVSGNFLDILEQHKISEIECGLIFTKFSDSVKNWQKQICIEIENWID